MEGKSYIPKTLSMNIINQLNAPPQTTALQKVFILIGLGAFLALVALTASLPLPVRKHQPNNIPWGADSEQYGNFGSPAQYTLGDTMWMIVATAMGILLTPAVAWLYANLYGRASSFSVQVTLLISAMIAVLWIVISFSLVYAPDANNDQILGFPKYYYMFAHVNTSPDATYTFTIPFSIFAIFELSFPMLSAALVTTALIDRVNVYGLMFFMFVWHLCYWAPIAHITWNADGFFYTNHIIDFSGGLVVSMTAGITATTLHLFLDWIKAPKAEARAPVNPDQLVLGAVFVWFLWFGINAGKGNAAFVVACQSIVNTIAGVASSVCAGYFLDVLHGIPVTDVTLVNSILIGLVATTPCSGFVTVGGAMVVTMITMLTCRILGRYLLKELENDTPYTIGTLHGIGGSTAFLFTALVSYWFVNTSVFTEDGFGNGRSAENSQNGLTWGQDITIRHHTAAVLAMWVCGFCALIVGAAICNLIVPLSKDKQSPNGDYAPTPLGPFSAAADAGKEQPDQPEENPEPVQTA